MIRTFILRNAKGKEINLLNNKDFFGDTPSGLGVSLEHGLYGANANFIQSGTAVVQQQFSIRLLFGAGGGNAYRRYKEFVTFLNEVPYTMVYKTDAGEYSRDCILSELTKTEISQYNIMAETLTLDFTTPFYQWVKFGDAGGGGGFSSKGKVYNYNGAIHGYAYSYHYGIPTLSKETRPTRKASEPISFELNNDSLYFGSSLGSPCEITIIPPYSAPSWKIEKDFEIVATDGYVGSTESAVEKLFVSSVPDNQRAEIYDGYGKPVNVFNWQDMTKTNFVTIPQGKSTITFSGVDSGQVEGRFRKEFLTI